MSIAPRAQRRAPRTNPAPDRAVALTPEQHARARGGPGAAGSHSAARRHRLGQDRGLPARLRRRARARARRDRARAGDRAHAADRRALPGALRRHRRGAALRARRRASATTSGCGCAAARRGSRRPALGRVRARSPTSGWSSSTRSTTPPTSTRATRATTRGTSPPSARAAPAPCSWPAARRRGRRPGTRCRGCRCRTASTRARCRRSRVLDMRGAQHPLHPRRARALVAARKSIVLLNRRGWSNFLTCRSAGRSGSARTATWRSCCTAPSGRSPATTAATASAVPDRCAHAARCRSRATARAPSGSRPSCAPRSIRSSGSTPTRRRQGRGAGVLARFEAAPRGRAARHADGRQGARLPGRRARRRPRRRQTLRFPDFRAEERTFALVAQLAGRAGRGPQGGRVLVQTMAPEAPSIEAAAAPRRRRASSTASSSGGGRCAIRRSRPDPRRRARPTPPSRPRGGRARRRARSRPAPGTRPSPRPCAAVPAARPRAQPGRRQGRRARAAMRATAAAVEAAAPRPRAARGVVLGRRRPAVTVAADSVV